MLFRESLGTTSQGNFLFVLPKLFGYNTKFHLFKFTGELFANGFTHMPFAYVNWMGLWNDVLEKILKLFHSIPAKRRYQGLARARQKVVIWMELVQDQHKNSRCIFRLLESLLPVCWNLPLHIQAKFKAFQGLIDQQNASGWSHGSSCRSKVERNLLNCRNYSF